ncbi:hypothetical protein D3218_13200 [Aureimonas flava]|uniref:Uncharacterized protein n=1 Tax=Aureimonas flava TaxID=2320271 RepID=A0A3A1WJ20_9HYPH|nr:hypothetical protein [Aureimonas flava]RIY00236.1 hypothetical protein D3218_13200 [Aureimonas flava]
MGHNPDGSITVSKLGDYAEFGYTLSATCEGFGCSRRPLAVTLEDLIRIFGPDWPFVERKPRIKCQVCGSNRISWIIGMSGREDRKTLGHSHTP